MIEETDDFDFDERVKVHETVVPGPHGEQAMLVTLEEDIHAHETIRKTEIVSEAFGAKSDQHHPHDSLDIGPSTLGTGHDHHFDQHKS